MVVIYLENRGGVGIGAWQTGEESDSVNLVKVRDSIYTGRNSKRKERNYH